MTLSMCFSIFLHISLYYTILTPLLPLIRRYISARACAMLWLLPNYLYIMVGITLSDHVIKIVPLYGKNPSASYHYLPQGVDWGYLDTIIVAFPQ